VWEFIRGYPVIVALMFSLWLALMFAVHFWFEERKIIRRKHKRLDLTGKKVR